MNIWIWNLIRIVILIFLFINNVFPQVNPFLIDEYSYQSDIKVDQLGQIHIVWYKWVNKGNIQTFYRIYDDAGHPLIDAIQLSNASASERPKIEVHNNKVICAWEYWDINDPNSNTYIKGCIIDLKDYSRKTLTLAYDRSTDFREPEISFINDTLFVVVFTNEVSVLGQLVTLSGNLIGDTFLINDRQYSYYNFMSPVVLSMSYPNVESFIVLWHDSKKIYARIFSNNAIANESSFIINEDPEIQQVYNFCAGIDEHGNIAVVFSVRKQTKWFENQWRWLNNYGEPIDNSVGILENEKITSVDICFGESTFVLAGVGLKNDISRIFCQRFSGERTPIGKSFTISSVEGYEGEDYPQVVLDNNRIFTTWTSYILTQDSIVNGSKGFIFMAMADFNNPPLSVSLNTSIKNQDITLLSNYPNPFNPSTSISYNLPYEGKVTLKVCDILGNEITTLVNEVKPAGEYQTEFDASSLSSGIYIYTIQANSSKGGFLDSKKMVVMK